MPSIADGLKRRRTCPRVLSCTRRTRRPTQNICTVRRGVTLYLARVARVAEAAERGSPWGFKYLGHRVKINSMAMDMRNGTFALEDTHIHGFFVDADKVKLPTKVNMLINNSHLRCHSGRLPYNRIFLPWMATKQAPECIAETTSRVGVHAGANGEFSGCCYGGLRGLEVLAYPDYEAAIAGLCLSAKSLIHPSMV